MARTTEYVCRCLATHAKLRTHMAAKFVFVRLRSCCLMPGATKYCARHAMRMVLLRNPGSSAANRALASTWSRTVALQSMGSTPPARPQHHISRNPLSSAMKSSDLPGAIHSCGESPIAGPCCAFRRKTVLGPVWPPTGLDPFRRPLSPVLPVPLKAIHLNLDPLASRMRRFPRALFLCWARAGSRHGPAPYGRLADLKEGYPRLSSQTHSATCRPTSVSDFGNLSESMALTSPFSERRRWFKGLFRFTKSCVSGGNLPP